MLAMHGSYVQTAYYLVMWIWDDKHTRQSVMQSKIKDSSRVIYYLMTITFTNHHESILWLKE